MDFLKGRMNRAVYWLCVGTVAVLLLLWTLLAPGTARVHEIVLVILCVPRLHDIGWSGWWVLAPLSLEIGAAVLAFTTLPLETAQPVMGVVVLVIFGLVAWLGTIPGQPHTNRFGEPPRPGLRSWRGS